MGGVFADTGMSGEEFEAQFIAEIQTNYHAAWILLSDIPNKGQLQVGAVLGFYSHPNPKMAPFMIVGDIIWFPWATPRVKIESAVNFFNKIRSEIPMMEYASEESKKFFEMIARHGIMRRIGTTFSVKRDEPMAVFETRAP